MKKDVLERRRTISERIFFFGFFVVLVAWSLFMVSMIVWAFISSLKTNLEYVNTPVGLPQKLIFSNYKVAMQEVAYKGVNFMGMLFNSFWYSAGTTIIGVLTTCAAGYILGQYEFKGKHFIFNMVIFIMIIPIFGSLAANYKMIYALHLNDSYLYLLTALSGFNGNTLITYGYYKALPKELRESVYMDGGSNLAAMLKIYLPLSRNIITALCLIGFIGGWNDYTTPLLYFDNMPTLATGMYEFKMEIQYAANNPAYFAGALIVSIPVVLLYILGSDKIMGQLYVGSIKG